MTQQALNNVAATTEQLKVMKETLDQDIARTAIACAQAEDAGLMQQLVGSVSKDHEFSPLLLQMALEMQSAKQARQATDVSSLDHRLGLMDIARDMAEARTETLDTETMVWQNLFNTAIALVPTSALAELAEEIEKQLQSQHEDGLFTELPGHVIEQLRAIQQS